MKKNSILARCALLAFFGLTTVQAAVAQELPQIVATNASVIEGNSGFTNLVFEVVLSQPSEQPVLVGYSTANGTAVAGADYIATNGVLVFQPQETQKLIIVRVLGDTVVEGNEILYLRLSNPTNATLSQTQVVGTIVDDECGARWTPTIAYISSVTNREGTATNLDGSVATTNFTFVVQLACPPEERVSVNYTTVNGTATGGAYYRTTNAGNRIVCNDYRTTSGTLIFEPGQMQARIDVPVYMDDRNEGTNVFYVVLSNPTNAILAVTRGVGAILNDDPLPGILVTNAYTPPEGDVGDTNYAYFLIRLTKPSGQTVKVNFSTTAGSAAAGLDFVPTNGVLTFNPEVTNIYIPVGIIGDVLVEGNEVFYLTLSKPVNAVLSNTTASCTITNDDGLPGQIHHFTWQTIPSPQYVDFGFPVAFTARDAQNNVLSNFNGTVSLFARQAGTQLVPVLPSEAVGFVNGRWQGVVRVLQTGSAITLVARDQYGHEGVSGAFAVRENLNTLKLWVVTNPEPPIVNMPATMTIVASNAGTTTLSNVLITAGTSGNISNPQFNILTTNAFFYQDYNEVIDFLAPMLQPCETVRIQLTATYLESGVILTNIVCASVLPPQYPLAPNAPAPNPPAAAARPVFPVLDPWIAVQSSSVLEGNVGTTSLQFQVQLLSQPMSNVTVKYMTVDGSAAAGKDYVKRAGTLTFTPTNLIRTVSVTINGDREPEHDETVLLYLYDPVNARLQTNIAAGVIINDDVLPVLTQNWLDEESCETFNTNTEQVIYNNAIDPGEQVEVTINLYNPGPNDTGNLTVVMPYLGAYGILPPDWSQNSYGHTNNYGVIPAGGSVGRSFDFIADGPCGGTVNAVLEVSDGTNFWTVTQPFLLGKGISTNASFTNRVAVNLSARSTFVSAINVTGLTGTVNRVSVTLSNFAVPKPGMVDIVLKGPSGKSAILLSGVGGSFATTNLIVTFDDEAGGSFTSSGPIVPGTYQPSISGGSNTLAAFKGTKANGAWYLYVTNKVSGANGIIGGWMLQIETLDTTCCVDPYSADLSLQVTDSPDPVRLGYPLTYRWVVSNQGPASAYYATLSNTLPNTVELLSVTNSRGTWNFANGAVVCQLTNPLPPKSNWVVTVAVRPVISPVSNILYSTATVLPGMQQTDPNHFNNSAITSTKVDLPTLTVANASVTEGNQGLTNLLFRVSLSAAVTQEVCVTYTTSNGTAMAGADFLATNGVLIFPPGSLTRTAVVQVIGDIVVENNETLYLLLSQPQNAVLATNRGVGTILDDDGTPYISIFDNGTLEGNVGSHELTFDVVLSKLSSKPVTVAFETFNSSALAGQDYEARRGLLYFPPGCTNQCVAVNVLGDVAIEANEVFGVRLFNPTNAALSRAAAYGTITNDDGRAGELFQFVWGPVGATQQLEVPISITITARDASSRVVSNYNGTADLRALQWVPGMWTNLLPEFQTYTNYLTNRTLGYSFTPSNHIIVFGMQAPMAQEFSLWTDTGTRLAQAFVSFNEMAYLAQPLLLRSGVTYRVSAYFGPYQPAFYSTNRLTAFPHGVIRQNYSAVGNAFPTTVFNGQALVNLLYAPAVLETNQVIPQSINFNNGIAQGQVMVMQPSPATVLVADDGDGHLGYSAEFIVMLPEIEALTYKLTSISPPPPGSEIISITIPPTGATGYALKRNSLLPAGPSEPQAGALSLTQRQFGLEIIPPRSRPTRVDVSADLLRWQPVLTNIPGVNQNTLIVPLDQRRLFFRVRGL